MKFKINDIEYNTSILKTEESFTEIMKDVEIIGVKHLLFIMRFNNKTKTNEFIADYNSEDGSMFFSYLKVWEIFREGYNMNDDEIKDFLYQMIYNRFGLSVKPY